MLYLIGLGLNLNGISEEGKSAIKSCKKIYLENYTVDFPYSAEELEKSLNKKIISLGRKDVESDKLVNEAKKEKIALLIYGSPLFATTHSTILVDCSKANVKTQAIYSASVFDAVACSGLQLYKFGKITSMPKWIAGKFTPESFMDIVRENESIRAHSLILCDIGLSFNDALNELEISAKNKKIKLDKIIVCSRLGTKESKIFYNTIQNLRNKKVLLPFCIIIPSEMHFVEKEALENVAK